MLREARKRSDKTFVLCDATNLLFKDSSLDAVFTVTTLEFLEDYRSTVKEIARGHQTERQDFGDDSESKLGILQGGS